MNLFNVLPFAGLHMFQVVLFPFVGCIVISIDCKIVEDILDIVQLLNENVDFVFSYDNHAFLSLNGGGGIIAHCWDDLGGDHRVWL